MELYKTFHKTLQRGYQGAIVYACEIPEPLQQLHITLTYNKEYIQDITQYKNKYKQELLPILSTYLMHEANEEEYDSFVKNMKTEIQLCAFLNDKFIGNIHQPGTKKQMIFSKKHISPGCIPTTIESGKLKIIVNCFQVIEEDTNIQLTIQGETYVEEN